MQHLPLTALSLALVLLPVLAQDMTVDNAWVLIREGGSFAVLVFLVLHYLLRVYPEQRKSEKDRIDTDKQLGLALQRLTDKIEECPGRARGGHE